MVQTINHKNSYEPPIKHHIEERVLMKVNRMDRVNELLRREICQVFEHTISPYTKALVTIVKVKTSPDLRQSTVYVSIMGLASEATKVMLDIKNKHGQIGREVAKGISLKYTPKLSFIKDNTFADADKIETILRNIAPEE